MRSYLENTQCKKRAGRVAWRYTSVILALGRQEDHKVRPACTTYKEKLSQK
jgi:hypothetical protein